MKINAGFLISYDYELLKTSLPLVYECSDSITLAVDKNRQTWSGNSFYFDESIFDWIKSIDKDNKIKIYQENFYIPELSAMENETRERNLLAKEMGEGWNLQIDADEYFIDFKGLVQYLRNLNKILRKKEVQICPYWIPMIKKIDDGLLYAKEPEWFFIGSKQANYSGGRKSKNQMKVYVPFLVLHQSFARNYEDLEFKLKNWGHNKDLDANLFLELWNRLDKTNYRDKEYKSFHPYDKKGWKKIDFAKGETMEEVIENLRNNQINIGRTKMFFKNIGQYIKHFKF